MNINQYHSANYSNYAQNQLSFTARNSFVKKMGDISMLARREFPMISNTRFESFGQIKSRSSWKFNQYISNMIGEERGFLSFEKSIPKRVLAFLDATKKMKMGNCSEYADVTCLACKVNGIKNAKTYGLYAYNPEKNKLRALSHVLVGVDLKETQIKPLNTNYPVYVGGDKGIIIDTWLGKTDYEKNMGYRHNKIFGKFIGENEKICYMETGHTGKLTEDDLIYIEKQYPGLSKKKKLGIIKRIKFFFMDKKKYEYTPFDTDVKEAHKCNSNLKSALSSAELTEFLTEKAKLKLGDKLQIM